MTGHHIEVLPRKTRGVVAFWCRDCDLSGIIMAPAELADATVADLMATHWAATGGDRT